MSLQFPSVTDTPYKSAVSVDLTRSKVYMDEVHAAVEREIKSTFYKVDTNTFVKRRIPAIKTLADSLKQLRDKDKGTFTGDRWKDYPEADSRPPREKDIYDPFAKILNAIVQTIPEDGVLTKIVYVDRHEVSPIPLKDDMADARPDGAGAHPDGRITALEEEIKRHKEKLSPAKCTRSVTMKDDQDHASYAEEKQKLVSAFILYRLVPH